MKNDNEVWSTIKPILILVAILIVSIVFGAIFSLMTLQWWMDLLFIDNTGAEYGVGALVAALISLAVAFLSSFVGLLLFQLCLWFLSRRLLKQRMKKRLELEQERFKA